MAGITLEYAEQRLAEYLAAEEKILQGQQVTIGDKRLTRADLAAVQAGIRVWDQRIQRLERGGMAVREVIPR